MKTAAYWAGRMETLNEALLNRGDAYAEAMRVEYDKATARINADVERWYARLAKNNGVSMADARQLLKAGELKEFRWTVEEYIKAGKENAVDQRWMKELENASAKVHISRLEAIQTQMQQHVEVLTAKRLSGTTETLGGIYKDGYYKSIFELQKGTGIGTSFAKLDKRQLDSVLAKPWAPDGRNFSARIWGDRAKLVNELHTTLTQGLIRGDAPEKMIKQLSERMGVSAKQAARLVLTESAYFAGQARMEGYKELGVEDYKYTATLDGRTSTLCKDMDGKVFKLSGAEPGVNYPPLHAHCRSTTIPHYEDNVKERAARDEDGEAYDVPGDTTYRQWAKEHAPEAAKPMEAPVTPPTPDVPTKVKTVEPVTSGQPLELTKPEESAITRYIGGESYVLNDKLRRAEPLSSPELEWVEHLDKALAKMPSYRGDVTRSLHFSSPDILADFMQDMRPGTVIQYPQYISTTKAKELYNPTGQVQFYVLNADGGKDISSYNPSELEVLYGRDYPFQVLEIEEIDGVYHILLQEWTK